jgi:hypothetical protein
MPTNDDHQRVSANEFRAAFRRDCRRRQTDGPGRGRFRPPGLSAWARSGWSASSATWCRYGIEGQQRHDGSVTSTGSFDGRAAPHRAGGCLLDRPSAAGSLAPVARTDRAPSGAGVPAAVAATAGSPAQNLLGLPVALTTHCGHPDEHGSPTWWNSPSVGHRPSADPVSLAMHERGPSTVDRVHATRDENPRLVDAPATRHRHRRGPHDAEPAAGCAARLRSARHHVLFRDLGQARVAGEVGVSQMSRFAKAGTR